MKRTLHRCFKPALMMLFMILLATTHVEAANGPSTSAYIFFSSDSNLRLFWKGEESVLTDANGRPFNPVPIQGASYNKADNTLTLANVNMPDTALDVSSMGDDFKVIVTGNNSLKGIIVSSYGWGANVTIAGNGTLELNEKKYKSEKPPITIDAGGSEGRVTFGQDVKLNAYKSNDYVIAIWGSNKKEQAPIDGKFTTPLILSGDSGPTEYGTYDWCFINDVISVNGVPKPTPGTAQSYTVKFNANGGDQPSKASVSVASGKTIGTLPTVGRKNYTFKGWYTKKSGGTKVTASTKIKKNQTLYAQWTKVSVKQASAPSVKKAASGKMSVKIKKVSGAKGYQITYSTSSDFKGSKNAATTSLNKTISKLKKGKTYYVKVRAYKLDSLKNKVYGKYSKTVKVKL